MSYQQFLDSNCDKGFLTYHTTDGTKQNVKIAIDADINSVSFESGSHGKYKLLLGYYQWTPREEYEPEQYEVLDTKYIPESDTRLMNGVVFYKTTVYKMAKGKLKSRGDSFTLVYDSALGYPCDIDILELKKLD